MTEIIPAPARKLKVLDLFSGIGGFSLGLERTGGFKTVAFCEIEPFCQRVLAKHWPEVPCYHDVRELTAERLKADGIAVDVICGGFPCQDISFAGKGAGLDGERSGLWSEIARLAGELRPRFLIVENVSALLGRGLERVLGDLAEIGFDAEWHCISASAIGAPHRRDRFWLVGYAEGLHGDGSNLYARGHSEGTQQGEQVPQLGDMRPDLADADCPQWRSNASPRQRVAWELSLSQWQESSGGFGAGSQDDADPNSKRLSLSWAQQTGEDWKQGGRLPSSNSWWRSEPDVGRVAHGVPSRVDRLRALGNAVVPQISELIGNAILASQQSEAA